MSDEVMLRIVVIMIELNLKSIRIEWIHSFHQCDCWYLKDLEYEEWVCEEENECEMDEIESLLNGLGLIIKMILIRMVESDSFTLNVIDLMIWSDCDWEKRVWLKVMRIVGVTL